MRKWLYDARIKLGYTQKQMGERLEISEAYYSLIENGERQKKLDITLAVKLADILSIPVQKIIDLETKEGE